MLQFTMDRRRRSQLGDLTNINDLEAFIKTHCSAVKSDKWTIEPVQYIKTKEKKYIPADTPPELPIEEILDDVNIFDVL